MITDEDILKIFRNIYYGKGSHGSFLRSLADCVIRADNDNFNILKGSLLQIINNYNLNTDIYKN